MGDPGSLEDPGERRDNSTGVHGPERCLTVEAGRLSGGSGLSFKNKVDVWVSGWRRTVLLERAGGRAGGTVGGRAALSLVEGVSRQRWDLPHREGPQAERDRCL